MSCKKRAANFNDKEETLLVNLVKNYKHVLECQQTDMKSHNAKSQTWLKIESEFNGISGEAYRPRDVLRKKYENIKKRVKTKYADEKCFTRGTGGGPHEKLKFTEVDTAVKDILGTRIEGKPSEFGGDAEMVPKYQDNSDDELPVELSSHMSPQENEYEENELITFVMVTNDDPPLSDNYTTTWENNGLTSSSTPSMIRQQIEMVPTLNKSNNNWAKHTPTMLKNAKSEALQFNKRNESTKIAEKLAITNRVSQWAEAKSQLEESRTRFVEKEHELEKHELELHLMKTKAELEMKLMEEESKAKLEVLQKQKIN